MLIPNYVIHWAGFQFDYVFDWTILKYQQAQMTTAPPRAIVSTMNKITLLPFLNSTHMDFFSDYAHAFLFRLQQQDRALGWLLWQTSIDIQV